MSKLHLSKNLRYRKPGRNFVQIEKKQQQNGSINLHTNTQINAKYRLLQISEDQFTKPIRQSHAPSQLNPQFFQQNRVYSTQVLNKKAINLQFQSVKIQNNKAVKQFEQIIQNNRGQKRLSVIEKQTSCSNMRKRPLMRKLNQHYQNSESLEQKFKSVSLNKIKMQQKNQQKQIFEYILSKKSSPPIKINQIFKSTPSKQILAYLKKRNIFSDKKIQDDFGNGLNVQKQKRIPLEKQKQDEIILYYNYHSDQLQKQLQYKMKPKTSHVTYSKTNPLYLKKLFPQTHLKVESKQKPKRIININLSRTNNFSTDNIKQKKPQMNKSKNNFLLNEDLIKNIKNRSVFININDKN